MNKKERAKPALIDAKRRKRIVWFAAATWMVGVLLTALVVLPTPEARSPALPEITETR